MVNLGQYSMWFTSEFSCDGYTKICQTWQAPTVSQQWHTSSSKQQEKNLAFNKKYVNPVIEQKLFDINTGYDSEASLNGVSQQEAPGNVDLLILFFNVSGDLP